MGTCVASIGNEDEFPSRSAIVRTKAKVNTTIGEKRSKRTSKGSSINQTTNKFSSDRHKKVSRRDVRTLAKFSLTSGIT